MVITDIVQIYNSTDKIQKRAEKPWTKLKPIRGTCRLRCHEGVSILCSPVTHAVCSLSQSGLRKNPDNSVNNSGITIGMKKRQSASDLLENCIS